MTFFLVLIRTSHIHGSNFSVADYNLLVSFWSIPRLALFVNPNNSVDREIDWFTYESHQLELLPEVTFFLPEVKIVKMAADAYC